MPLTDIFLPDEPDRHVPSEVRRFVREADRRVAEFQVTGRLPAFVPSDYLGAYRVLRELANGTLARGNRFCEWGGGFGAVAGLAAKLDYDSHGIEAEGELVDAARRLADDFDLSVEFAHGSFVPRGAEGRVHKGGTYSWFTTEGDYAYDELGLEPDDFDVIFAYPWPDEEAVTADLFARYAGDGAILVTYHGGSDFRLRRKAAGKKSRRR
jgi:hypothetical protein